MPCTHLWHRQYLPSLGRKVLYRIRKDLAYPQMMHGYESSEESKLRDNQLTSFSYKMAVKPVCIWDANEGIARCLFSFVIHSVLRT